MNRISLHIRQQSIIPASYFYLYIKQVSLKCLHHFSELYSKIVRGFHYQVTPAKADNGSIKQSPGDTALIKYHRLLFSYDSG